MTAERMRAAGEVAKSILPPEAAPIERALLAVEIMALADADPRVIATIWDPWHCPAVLLPWLAWALSVDVWDPSWDDGRKRKVIAASPAVHRLKGTRGAVRRALDAFDLESVIIEWWEEEPPARRGTFRVETVYRNGGPAFDPVTQSQAIDAVRASKPVSRVFTTRAILQARGPAYVGAFARTHLAAVAHPYAFDGDTRRATVAFGATAAAILSATAHPKG